MVASISNEPIVLQSYLLITEPVHQTEYSEAIVFIYFNFFLKTYPHTQTKKDKNKKTWNWKTYKLAENI